MKKYISIATIVVASLFFNPTITAQPAPEQSPFGNMPQPQTYGEVRPLPAMVLCGSKDNINIGLAGKKEVAYIESISILQIPNRGVVPGKSILYMNPETKSYSLVFYMVSPMVPNPWGIEACFINMGREAVPALQGTAM